MAKVDKREARLRRAQSTRHRIRELMVPRLTVHRSGQHIYAQVFDASGAKVLASASTVQSEVSKDLKSAGKGTGNVDAAKAVGREIAARAKAAGISKVAFDRSGFRFHGRVKALADAAREAGLEF